MIMTLHRIDKQHSGIGQTLENFKSTSDPISRGIQKQELYQQTMAVKRVVYIGSKYDFNIDKLSRSMVDSITRQDDNMSYNRNNNQNDDQSQDEESPYQQFNTKGDESCEPMAKWQSMSFPTCNAVHEMNIFSTSPHLALRSQATNIKFRGKRTNSLRNIIQDSYSAKLLGNGWFRDAWKVSDEVNNSSFAIKTLRLERDFMPEYFELHRRDSVALERLTESPYVMDIYGFCGHSAVTELAFLNNGLNNLYRMATVMMNNFSPYILRTKLQIAAMTARAMAHVHSVPIDDEHLDKLDKQYRTPASIVHYDINPRNVIISPSGRPKLNDFNVAEFLTWDPMKNTTCGFQGRFREPWWRSPEEMMQSVGADNNQHPTRLDEKVDIYSLGNTLFVLLTGTEPRGKKQKKKRFRQVSQELANGLKPPFPAKYKDSDDPVIVAIRNAIMLCWEPDPDRRPLAMEIADQLYTALGNLA